MPPRPTSSTSSTSQDVWCRSGTGAACTSRLWWSVEQRRKAARPGIPSLTLKPSPSRKSRGSCRRRGSRAPRGRACAAGPAGRARPRRLPCGPPGARGVDVPTGVGLGRSAHRPGPGAGGRLVRGAVAGALAVTPSRGDGRSDRSRSSASSTPRPSSSSPRRGAATRRSCSPPSAVAKRPSPRSASPKSGRRRRARPRRGRRS